MALPLEVLFIAMVQQILKSDPGLCNLASKVVLAKEIRKELMEGDDPMSDEQRDLLQDGLEAEKIIRN